MECPVVRSTAALEYMALKNLEKYLYRDLRM